MTLPPPRTGAEGPPPARVVPAAALLAFGRELLERRGVAAEHAAAIAEVSVWASTRGIDSHGIVRVPRYLEMFDSGAANLRPELRIRPTAPAVEVVDADWAPGPVALRAAADAAVRTAREAGAATVAVRHTVLSGAIGYYTNRIAESGFVGICVVAGMPTMAYTGARGPAVATSPLSIAVPSRRHPTVLLDMATATIALGRIAEHRASGTRLPEGSAATEDGTPTVDPEEAAMALPLGGAKGSGMSLAFELITGVLVGAPILSELHGGVPGGRPHRQNALVMALDPAAFGDAGTFPERVDATTEALKGLPVADGAGGIFLPGERSSAVAAERLERGVPVSHDVWAQLVEAATALGVEVPTGSAQGHEAG